MIRSKATATALAALLWGCGGDPASGGAQSAASTGTVSTGAGGTGGKTPIGE